jgi:hypothetical protein
MTYHPYADLIRDNWHGSPQLISHLFPGGGATRSRPPRHASQWPADTRPDFDWVTCLDDAVAAAGSRVGTGAGARGLRVITRSRHVRDRGGASADPSVRPRRAGRSHACAGSSAQVTPLVCSCLVRATRNGGTHYLLQQISPADAERVYGPHRQCEKGADIR